MRNRTRAGLLGFAAILSTAFFALIAVSLAVPDSNHPSYLRSVAGALLGIGLVWGSISTWARIYVYERAGRSSPMKLLPGPRPSDPIEIRAWIWKWNFFGAALLVLLCGLAISVSIWLQEHWRTLFCALPDGTTSMGEEPLKRLRN
jgi:hypothetical protein